MTAFGGKADTARVAEPSRFMSTRPSAKVSRLSHLRDVEVRFFFRNCVRVVGKIPKKMTEILLFAPFDQKPGNVHVHVHSQMPIGHALVHLAGEAQSEERSFYRGQ
jgi:hypothetical protein